MAEWKRGPSSVPRRAARGARAETGLVAETALGACGDVLNGATWHGESAAELIQIIRDSREIDDPAEKRPDRVESPGKIL